MLRANDVNQVFKQKHGKIEALKNVTLKVDDGDYISITGPSGSGKSTLMLILGGMTKPSSGDVFWNDKNIYRLSVNERTTWRGKAVGFMFQTFNLVPYLNVYENIDLSLNVSGNNSEKDRIDTMLERMGLQERTHHLPRELSVGQQQRVALARALIKNPSIILADEPTGNLDPETANGILELLERINGEGKTIVLITHDPNIACRAKRNIRINNGAIIN